MINYSINNFMYAYTNAFGEGSFTVLIERTSKGAKLTYTKWLKKKGKTYKIKPDKLLNLEQICRNAGVEAWDGFHGEAVDVLDGDGFSLRIDFENWKMNAYGTNCYPKGYADFIKEFQNFIEPYRK